ncbi:MAG: hypothetical protein ACYDC4_13930 [Candidatus Dormibacteria bacterium]
MSLIRALSVVPPLIGPHAAGVADGVGVAKVEGVAAAVGVALAVGRVAVGVPVPLVPPHAARNRTAAGNTLHMLRR